MKYRHTKEDLEAVIKDSLSTAEVCRKLGIRPIGGNYKTLKSKILKWGLDTSHFTGGGWNVGLKFKPKVALDLNLILIENSPYVSSTSIKKRLIQEGILSRKCKNCLLDSWNNSPIPLELNHINGNNLDHRLENLELLCPNCHAQTPNYRGKNLKRSARSEKIEVEYRKFKETPAEMRGNLEPSFINKEGAETLHGKPKVKMPKSSCKICTTPIFGKSKVYCSYECKNIGASSKIPTYEELLKAFEELNNFLQVGKRFNVSDNAVRKWCIRYGILDKVKKKSSAQTEISE